MGHIPHLVLASGWPADIVAVDERQRHHIASVLRRSEGDPITYTDGAGTTGSGTWTGLGVERGDEQRVPLPTPRLTMAVSPPDSKDRVRWLVEKSTELGVGRIRWLRSAYTQGRVPRHDRCVSWMIGAVEQSRGAWLTDIDDGWSTLDDLDAPWVAAQSGGTTPRFDRDLTVAIGPEGGWAPEELPDGVERIHLGDRILRTETAAVAVAVAAALEPHWPS